MIFHKTIKNLETLYNERNYPIALDIKDTAETKNVMTNCMTLCEVSISMETFEPKLP